MIFFGTVPLSKHVVVVKNLSLRFPDAKITSSASAPKVLPALAASMMHIASQRSRYRSMDLHLI